MSEHSSNGTRSRIKELEKEISELKKRMPAHSVKPEMVLELEEKEEELKELLKKKPS
ncbi:hypothetical protein [Natranaerofaba carboxydovora]|uniref:hypothetical protein n=1 Tax=Natranaerofaba carboxydovora TaxID=2742683 RepID=UPI001F146747|nr:hypothetical protein [Natranaerofaba carboxydovora]UMZ75447.1 hypothetical protein ACONDI_03075 [Natranaerofaba carboxydovora]